MYPTNYCGKLLHLNHLQIETQSLQAHTQKQKLKRNYHIYKLMIIVHVRTYTQAKWFSMLKLSNCRVQNLPSVHSKITH